ncbi:hypothetical protein HZC35_03930 [Candidatus Saganbacteria bacterium]|nr:hypothetical protein [Candidatus Saganbacteria bacterium]
MYAAPKEKIDQSDIFKNIYFHSIDNTQEAILITPICDMYQGKADYLIFCGVFLFNEIIMKFIEKCWKEEIPPIFTSKKRYEELSGSQKKNVSKRIAELRSNFHFPRYHWLDPFPGEEESHIIDFQCLASINIDEFAESDHYERLFSINSPYREQIPARYSAYMSRVGTPDSKESEKIIDHASKDAFKTFNS